MAFNKAKEEYKWKQWKEAEESKMRELGVQEEIILSYENKIGKISKRKGIIMSINSQIQM